ncbi:MAG: VWA domain-containing protein [Candidatus Bipolaricaulota bacterium]|nr:VWA domain-containing protein [Candidatus Bipolaricaulota bacterium]MDW8152102.1 VWA domain-containing protein [Candidatus Bipolaricaulota bacterium]
MRLLWPWALALLVLPAALLLLGWRRGRRLVGRALTLALLGLALAQPELALRRERERVVFVVDRSASVGEAALPAFWELAGSAAARGAEIGVVVAAGGAAVVRPPQPGLPRALASPVDLDPARTDLGAALHLALALLEGKGQIVAITDGRDTEGQLWAAAAQARAQGVPVHVFPVGQEDPLRLLSFRGPEAVPPGAAAEFLGVLAASRPLPLRARLLLNGKVAEERDLRVEPGRTELAFVLALPEEGLHLVELVLDCPEDPLGANNRLSWAVRAGPAPEVLVVGREAGLVDAALAGLGLRFRRVEFLRPADLAGVGLVILDDFPLGLLGAPGVEALRAFVAEGGGLLVVQGRRALSGYAGALEEILPVTYAVPERVRAATAAVVFVLDRSASMAGRAGEVTKLDLLKEAAAAAAELVPPEDWLGALAFDRTPFWLAPPGPAEQTRPLLFAALAGLFPSGGTDLWPAVLLALSALENVPARLRHMIVISDGKTVRENRAFPALYQQVAQSGVGVTAIAIGPDADLEILGGLAQAGRGELHVLVEPKELRAVLVQETKRAVRPRFVEGEFPVYPGPAALAAPAVPPVHGYALTFPKPTAEVALLLPGGDPLLAFWRVGLGTVAVLNTDLRGGWTRAWATDPSWLPHFAALLEELWPQRKPLGLAWELRGKGVVIRLDVERDGRWVHGLRFSGRLAGPGGAQELGFRQVAPGRYEAELPHPGAGAYLLAVAEATGQYGGTAVLALPYPPEYAELGPDRETLGTLARLTGGALLEDEELPERSEAVADWIALWPALLWAGAAAFVLDLALRKLLSV